MHPPLAIGNVQLSYSIVRNLLFQHNSREGGVVTNLYHHCDQCTLSLLAVDCIDVEIDCFTKAIKIV